MIRPGARALLPMLLSAFALGACAVPEGPKIAAAPTPSAQVAVVTAPAPRPKSEPARPRFESRQLIGLTESDVANLLGQPTLLRRDPPAEVWQYARRDCVLFLFLYDAKGESGHKVNHVEMRSRGGADMSVEDCLAALVRAGSIGES